MYSETMANHIARQHLPPELASEYNTIMAPGYRSYKVGRPLNAYASTNSVAPGNSVLNTASERLQQQNLAMGAADPKQITSDQVPILKSVRRYTQRLDSRFDQQFRKLHGEYQSELAKQAAGLGAWLRPVQRMAKQLKGVGVHLYQGPSSSYVNPLRANAEQRASLANFGLSPKSKSIMLHPNDPTGPALFHEAGHAFDPDVSKRMRPLGQTISGLVGPVLDTELAANALARGQMPKKLIPEFNQKMVPGYRSYKVNTPMTAFLAQRMQEVSDPFSVPSRAPRLIMDLAQREANRTAQLGGMTSAQAGEGIGMAKSLRRQLQRESPDFNQQFRQFHQDYRHHLAKPASASSKIVDVVRRHLWL